MAGLVAYASSDEEDDEFEKKDDSKSSLPILEVNSPLYPIFAYR